MSSRKSKKQDVLLMQKRINEGILLAQRRLLNRGLHDDLSFIVCQEGHVCDIPARDITMF